MNVVANLCLARAYQSAESSWLAPIDYSYLIFATFWGFVLFAEVPTFRGQFPAGARLFSNAVVYGPGLGADAPIGW